MTKKIISLDAETNGLWGNPFAIAAIIYEDGIEVERVSFRCPINDKLNEWVEQNVLPKMVEIPLTHKNLKHMYQAFAEWYMNSKQNATIIWHMGHVVEANIFRDLVSLKMIGEWDAPYTPIEVSMLLYAAGEPADSVDSYLLKHGITKPKLIGGTHNPLYDAEVAAKVFFHLQSK